MTQPAYLELSEITKQLGNRRVLDDVSLSLEKGELLGLLGPSGSGKTTLLNIVGGFLAPEEGSVRIAGESILALAPHRRDIGITFQGYALFPHMNVSQNVAYGLRQRRVPKAEILDRVGAMLDLLGLRKMERRFLLKDCDKGATGCGQTQRFKQPDATPLIDHSLKSADHGIPPP